MKLAMTLLVRDEVDIVRVNIEHHFAQGVDVIVAMDNGSIDGTREILGEYCRDGNVVVLDEPAKDYQQWRWVTRMARLAAVDHGADWILHSDADEFWWADDGDLKAALEVVPSEFGWVSVPRLNLMPTQAEDGPFFERLVVRHEHSLNPLGRPLIGKVCHRADPVVWIAQGNHEVLSSSLQQYREPVPITILHFPFRTYAQFERKIVLGGRAYVRNSELDERIGESWRRLYDEYLNGDLHDWYERQIPTVEQLACGVATGEYVVDRRLERFCRASGLDRIPVPTHPRHVFREPRRSAELRAPPVQQATIEILTNSRHAGLAARLEARLVEFIDAAEASIACAVFDLRATAVAAALHEARERGVSVRLVHGLGERSGMEPGASSAVLESWALPFTSRPRMHHKFVVRDEVSVWTGSADFTRRGLRRQDNDCVIVNHERIARAYLDAFEGRVPTENSARIPLPDGELVALFAPGDAIRRFVVSALESADRVRMMVFTLADPAVLSALRRRRDAGADIAGVYDLHGTAAVIHQTPFESWFLSDTAFTAATNRPFDPSGEHDCLHNNLVVVDDTVITGSANLASEAPDSEENVLVIRSPSYAADYTTYVETVAAAYRRTSA